MVLCPLDPPIEHSIVKIAESRWLLGSSMICETDLAVPPDDALARWISKDGKPFYLRKSPYSSLPTMDNVSELSEVDRVHHAGTSAAVWAFGSVHLKAKSWIPELQSESETIEYVQKTSIPLPEVVFSWVDTKWNRSFLITKSIEGRTLDQAWPALSQDQKAQIAQQIASYCAELALSTSQRMESLSGNGVREPWLTKDPSPSEPSWKPFVQGPFTVDQLQTYIQDTSIDLEPEFCFYHADLGPTNIMLDDNGHIAAVIDWESAAFYPRFFVATKPLFSAGFNLTGSDRSAWAFLLTAALEEQGFKDEEGLLRRWKAATKN